MPYSVSIRHNFETAHRLSHPDAPTKCQSIHGHSWWATVWIEGDTLDEGGMLVEFGALKRSWRALLDDELDHHLVVQRGDPVIDALKQLMPSMRIQVFDDDPTTEHMARWIFERTCQLLAQLEGTKKDLRVAKVHIQETAVNAAEYVVTRQG